MDTQQTTELQANHHRTAIFSQKLKSFQKRNKNALINQLLAPFHQFIKLGFKDGADKHSPMKRACSYNAYNFLGKGPGMTINYERFILTRGPLESVESPAVLQCDEGIDIVWNFKESDSKAKWNDVILVLVYFPKQGIAMQILSGTLRSDDHINLSLHKSFRKEPMEIYISATSASGKAVANSTYLGRHILC